MFKPVLVFALLLSGCANLYAGTATPDIATLAAEFQDLRAVRGSFDGADWNDDVDQWMGRKHQLMLQLGSQLGGGQYSASQVMHWLGPPDQSAGPGDDVYELVSNLHEFTKPGANSYEFLIYHWRGEHDFLYFTIQGGNVAGSGWWYAYE